MVTLALTHNSNVLLIFLALKLYILTVTIQLHTYIQTDRQTDKETYIHTYIRKMFGNVRLAFGTNLENLRKSSESGRKSSENRQKRRHQQVYITR